MVDESESIDVRYRRTAIDRGWIPIKRKKMTNFKSIPADKRILFKNLDADNRKFVRELEDRKIHFLQNYLYTSANTQEKFAPAVNHMMQTNKLYYPGFNLSSFNKNNIVNMYHLLECPYISNLSKMYFIHLNIKGSWSFSKFDPLFLKYPEMHEKFMSIVIPRLIVCPTYNIVQPKTVRLLLKLIRRSPAAFFWYTSNSAFREIRTLFGDKVVNHLLKRYPKNSRVFLKNMSGSSQRAILSIGTIELLVQENPSNLQYVKKELITPDMARTACSKSGSALKYVPRELRTKELCEIACEITPSALKYTPKAFRNKQIILKHALKGHNTLQYN